MPRRVPDATIAAQGGEPASLVCGEPAPAAISRGVAVRRGGEFALENYGYALALARDGRADAVCFTPFNKKAMRLARPAYDDEIAFSAEVVGLEGAASEVNILDKLWNARVTSHVPLAQVPARLTKERISRALRLTDACMRSAASRVRALWLPGSTRTRATAAISAARSSRTSRRWWRQASGTASVSKGRSRPIPSSFAPKAARSMRYSRCTTIRAKSR